MKQTKPFKARLIQVALTIVWIAMALLYLGVLYLAGYVWGWPWWGVVFALLLVVVCVAGALRFLVLDPLRDRHDQLLRSSGYGVDELRSTIREADRRVIADILELEDYDGDGGTTTSRWTSIRVDHTAEMPCVIELVRGPWFWLLVQNFASWAVRRGKRRRIRFFDKDAYMASKSSEEDPRVVPKKVKIHEMKVPTAYPKKMLPMVMDRAQRLFDWREMPNFRGIVRIEPGQVFSLQPGYPLEGEHLRAVVGWLIRLAEKTESEF